ncbi:Ist1p [Perilla frutescens var. hirtella]|nr:Ist1p [Perilla frutescens var. hirtella]
MFDILFGWRKASKCKKLIKRVQCRLKLLKSKRSCIVKQLREDVAELLKHGHDQAAFERVEQVVMDENMVEVYDLLYHFCEFVIINLPYIRKHRDCPNDINEAVSTLIFSSARFGELPELLSVRKLFGERYNKKLVTNALELLPGNHVSNQIIDNLDMKNVADDVKYKFLDDIARSCIKTEPLLLEYKSELQENENADCWKPEINDEKFRKESCFGLIKEGDFGNEIYSSSENSARLGEEVIYLDDIEEFISPVIKDGNLQDQRLFMFKSFELAFNAKADHGIDIKAEERTSSLSTSSKKSRRKRSRIRSLIQDNLNAADNEFAAYYGESDEGSPQIRRKSHHQRGRNAVLVKGRWRNDHKWELSAIKKWSLGQPCYFSTREVSKAVEAEQFSTPRLEAGKQTLPSTLRAITMPCERHRDGSVVTDNINRSNSFPLGQSDDVYSPCSHIHPKLPDYDELAAKFMELKRANLQKK